MTVRFGFSLVWMMTILSVSVHAQRVVTFDARHADAATLIVLDSVHIVNLTNGSEHTLIGAASYDLDLLTSVIGTSSPSVFALSVNYPNAFTDATSFTVQLPRPQSLRLQVFDLHGRLLVVHSAALQSGQHRFSFVASGLAHGVYILTVNNGSTTLTRKLLKLGNATNGMPAMNYLGHASAAFLDKTVADRYRFTGYAEAFESGTIDNVSPQSGKMFSFDLSPSAAVLVDPATRHGMKGSTYEWTVQCDAFPSRARFSWQFGDGQSRDIDDQRSVTHSYSSEGTYELRVRMYNLRNGNFISEAGATVHIATEGRITTGDVVEVARGNIAAAGGRITVDQAGTPVTGMSIEVGARGYGETREFSISHAPVLTHGMGEDFIPVSPLITVANGGGYSEDPMILCIPITLPEHHFAMMFYYDEETGELEGLPLIGVERDRICVATRHFSSTAMRMGKRSAGMKDGSYVQLIVAAVSTDRLSGTVMSRFRPGVDDWEFPNYGSYISPKGQCAGQTISAMWYYSARKLGRGEAALNSRFDDVHTDLMWMDNPRGYRLSSVIQEDIDWSGRETWWEHFDTTGTGVYSRDSLNFLAFKYAVLMTEKPQYIAVRRPGGGHALVLYGVLGDSLLIADPNYPGISRGTSLREGAFRPYRTMSKVGESPKEYPTIRYYAKSAMIDYQILADRWSQFEQGTIGTIAPHVFPSVELFQLTTEGTVPLESFVTTSSDTLVIIARCPDCVGTFDDDQTAFVCLKEQGQTVALDDNGIIRIPVVSGRQRYGLLLQGFPSDTAGTTSEYISFVWLEVEKMSTASFGFGVNAKCSDTGARGRYGTGGNSFSIPGTWSGDTFSGDLDMLYEGYRYVISLVATVDTVTNEMGSYEFRSRITKDDLDMVLSLTGRGVPLLSHGTDTYHYGITGEEACSHIDEAQGYVVPSCGQLTEWDCKEHVGKPAFLDVVLPARP